MKMSAFLAGGDTEALIELRDVLLTQKAIGCLQRSDAKRENQASLLGLQSRLSRPCQPESIARVGFNSHELTDVIRFQDGLEFLFVENGFRPRLTCLIWE